MMDSGDEDRDSKDERRGTSRAGAASEPTGRARRRPELAHSRVDSPPWEMRTTLTCGASAEMSPEGRFLGEPAPPPPGLLGVSRQTCPFLNTPHLRQR